MTTLPLPSRFDRLRWVQVADWLAIGVAVTLPWSTSATSVLIALWLIVFFVTLDVGLLRRELASAAGLLPVLLWVLAAVGMLWADVSVAERLGGLGKFHRLLVIPLLLAHFRRSARGAWVLYGFFAAVVAVLIVSWGLVVIPGLPWRGRTLGVPAKDYIFQSTNFLICALALLGFACAAARARRWRSLAGLTALAGLFLANMLFVATSRTALLVAPVLLVLLGWREFRWKGLVGAAALCGILAGGAWLGSPYLRDRLATSVQEFRAYRTSDAPNSTGLHLEFLKKSLLFVESAPVIGHGTGSIPEEFRESAVRGSGAASALSQNPHNQLFAVAIQLGLVGAAVLVAMWVAHLRLFAGSGLVAWIGTVVVVQNIIFSLFNSHLFDFTAGWLYVFGVGVAGGTLLRARDGGPDPIG
jgi:O-antigen ligase